MGLFDLISDVIAAPIVIAAKSVDLTIKTVEAVPDIIESAIEKAEKALDEVGK